MKSKKDKDMQNALEFPKKPKTRALQVEIPEDLFKSLNDACQKLNVTKKDLVMYGISQALIEAKKKI